MLEMSTQTIPKLHSMSFVVNTDRRNQQTTTKTLTRLTSKSLINPYARFDNMATILEFLRFIKLSNSNFVSVLSMMWGLHLSQTICTKKEKKYWPRFTAIMRNYVILNITTVKLQSPY